MKFLPWLFLLGGVVSSAVAAGLVILKVVAADETALPAASFSAVLTILVFAQVLGLTGVLGLARRPAAAPVQPLEHRSQCIVQFRFGCCGATGDCHGNRGINLSLRFRRARMVLAMPIIPVSRIGLKIT